MCLLLPFHRTGAKPHGGRPNGRESRRFRPAGRRRRTGRAYKPDSVPLAGRRPSLSTPCRHGALAANPGVITGRAPSSPIRPCSGWGLPGRPVARDAGALLPHHFTLTRRSGRFVSVALSVGFRRPGVTRHPARRSPDFPLARTPAAARPARSSAILAPRHLPGANAKGAGIAPAPSWSSWWRRGRVELPVQKGLAPNSPTGFSTDWVLPGHCGGGPHVTWPADKSFARCIGVFSRRPGIAASFPKPTGPRLEEDVAAS